MKDLNQEQLLEYWDGVLSEDPYEEIEFLGVVDTWRWGTIEAKVLKHKDSGKHYKLTATFHTQEGIQDDILVCEVRPKEVTTIKWVSVSKEG